MIVSTFPSTPDRIPKVPDSVRSTTLPTLPKSVIRGFDGSVIVSPRAAARLARPLFRLMSDLALRDGIRWTSEEWDVVDGFEIAAARFRAAMAADRAEAVVTG